MNKAVTIILSVSEMLGSSLHTCMMKKTDQGQLLNIHLNSSNFLFLFTNNSSFFSLQCYALIPVTASYRHTFLSSGTCTLVKTCCEPINQWQFEEDVFQYSEHFTLQICEMTDTVKAAVEGEENSLGMEEQREI